MKVTDTCVHHPTEGNTLLVRDRGDVACLCWPVSCDTGGSPRWGSLMSSPLPRLSPPMNTVSEDASCRSYELGEARGRAPRGATLDCRGRKPSAPGDNQSIAAPSGRTEKGAIRCHNRSRASTTTSYSARKDAGRFCLARYDPACSTPWAAS